MAVEPTPVETVAPASSGMNWKMRTYFVGAVIGLILGLLSAYLFVRAAEENNHVKTPQSVGTLDGMKLTLTILGLIRQIAELGAK